jgi:hypothetical protein
MVSRLDYIYIQCNKLILERISVEDFEKSMLQYFIEHPQEDSVYKLIQIVLAYSKTMHEEIAKACASNVVEYVEEVEEINAKKDT